MAQVPFKRGSRLMFMLPSKSRTHCRIQPANLWGWDEILANRTNYLLDVLVWQNSKDAQKKHPVNQPKPFSPPFFNLDKVKREVQNREKVVMSSDKMRDLLNRPRKPISQVNK